MQVVKLSLIFFLMSCFQKEPSESMASNLYQVEKYQSRNGFSYLTLSCYSLNDRKEKLPCLFVVNGLAFNPIGENDQLVLSLLTGKKEIKAAYVGFETTLFDVDLQTSDSLDVKVFLKPADLPD